MRFRFFAVVFLVILAATALSTSLWLPFFATALIHVDPIEPADAVVVLGGDWKGERVLAACELVRQGVAPIGLISGPMDLYGRNEGDLAIEFAASKGCSAADQLQTLRIQASSTEEEARAMLPEVRKRNIHKLLVLTSNYHSARAGRIFRRVFGSSASIRVYGAPDANFDPVRWWGTREGRKTAFYEWTKTIAEAVGL